MDIVSFSFLLFTCVAIASLRLLPQPRMRPIIVFLLNVVFFLSFLHHATDALPILGMMGFGYACLLIAERKPSRVMLGIMIAITVVIFIWLKRYAVIMPLLPAEASALMVVGLSYILFRILHLLVDVAQGVRPAPPLLGYVNYCLFFPTFLSGPIARYEQFDHEIKRSMPPLSVPLVHAALCRIALGLMLVVVCSAYASTVTDWVKSTNSLATPDHAAWLKTALLFSLTSFAAFIKLYTNFSGSMHIIIGIGVLAGFNLPENFNKPYLAKNFLDYWARWHITLSEWIKYYIFNPLLAAFARRFPSRRMESTIGAIAFFVTFFIIGVWHGSTTVFAIYGVMLGVAATTNKLWQQAMIRYLGKARYKSLAQRNWYFQLARGLTLSYIAIALFCLWIDSHYIQENGAVWLGGIMTLSLAFLTATIALFGGVVDALTRHFGGYVATWHMPSSAGGMMFVMVLIAWVLFNHLGGYASGTPELVYKGF